MVITLGDVIFWYNNFTNATFGLKEIITNITKFAPFHFALSSKTYLVFLKQINENI